ncbi:unnamed protein product [Penicillium nalgiovense]|uniref:DUF8035 domain-containing protein n=1 Tax=Penicillium nalgiovense TaxID=60175 RepID=A0A1V6YYN1_PENNA|nr:hypothetical protein PENNAL_c0007G05143 [Penicillium nalgiovense]CAG7977444.1 unnamed protein product [Penicillium nalgiovense]CAG8026448.1 unnamed protein product [Penicillium nalgiovense]CAG8046801.1 unnamed protein product [Penicillium nalgiovense]CAG8064631.1 unnamed protein product [Penicillium nalgiovense]
MSRRAPPRDYNEQDEFYEMEREPEREYRPRRRHHDYEDDVEYHRRRSEPLAEDMERMHIRERPRRDFMEESFAPPRARDDVVLMRSREEVDMVSPERYMPLDHDGAYRRPSGSRRRPRPRGVDEEDFIFDERERRRGTRRYPRDIEEDLIFMERQRREDGRHRPEREREDEDDPFIDEKGRHRDRRYRRERASEEDLLFEERARERGSGRRRRLEPEFEEDDELILERERRRGSRRHPQKFEEDDFIIEDREIHRGSRRHPERRSEDDLLFEDREKRHRRRRPEWEFDEDLLAEDRAKPGRRRHRPGREFEKEEMVVRRKEWEEPPLRRGWDSELDIQSRERRLEFEEEPYRRPRPRPPPPQRVEVEEVLLDNAPSGRNRGPIDSPDQESEEDDVVIRRKDKGLRPVDRVGEEEIVIRGREKRRSVPSEDLQRELRGLRREDGEQIPLDEELSVRSQLDSKSRSRGLEEVNEEISIRKTKDKLPSRQPSPSLDSIHALPIRQEDLFTHDRNIDHGYKDARTPRVRSPEPRSRRGSFDEIDIHHRKMRGGRMSDESIALKHSDSDDSLAPEDSISPTSGPAVDFNDPWERETTTATRRRPKPLEDESELAYSRGIRDAPSMHDVEKDTMIESTRLVNKAPRGTDDWSVVHTPPPDEPIEMTGALDVVEVKPRHASVAEAIGRISQQVTDPEETRNDRWTEIAKRLVVREAIEHMGFEYEETRTCYYIFSYLKSDDIDELVGLSDEIRSARRRRIRDIQRERASVPDLLPRTMPRVGMPPRARMIEKRMQDIRDREWVPRR